MVSFSHVSHKVKKPNERLTKSVLRPLIFGNNDLTFNNNNKRPLILAISEIDENSRFSPWYLIPCFSWDISVETTCQGVPVTQDDRSWMTPAVKEKIALLTSTLCPLVNLGSEVHVSHTGSQIVQSDKTISFYDGFIMLILVRRSDRAHIISANIRPYNSTKQNTHARKFIPEKVTSTSENHR